MMKRNSNDNKKFDRCHHTDQSNTAKLLIENEADFNHKGAFDETPIISAAEIGKCVAPHVIRNQ